MVMVTRNFWQNKINTALQHRSIVWLSGVRRIGKTNLCKSLSGIEYFDCELPSTRQMLDAPEMFLKDHQGKLLVLDEIHRLSNPAELLKIAADYYPNTKVIATGSSTLGASAKFKDTLAGRKTSLWFTPILVAELENFQSTKLPHRLLHGGLPPFFLSPIVPTRDFQEWLDAYWAKDILELFRLERRFSFHKFIELLLVHSGSIFEATKFTSPCEISRGTINNYLSILEATHTMHVIRPFNSHRANEIIAAPKVYGFDTGFVCHARGLHTLRPDDYGNLWEHLVLNEIQGQLQTKIIYYWRNKQKNEIDFVLSVGNHQPPLAIECKWSSQKFKPDNLKIFRCQYPHGKNFVVAADIQKTFSQKYDQLIVKFVNLDGLITELLEQEISS